MGAIRDAGVGAALALAGLTMLMLALAPIRPRMALIQPSPEATVPSLLVRTDRLPVQSVPTRLPEPSRLPDPLPPADIEAGTAMLREAIFRIPGPVPPPPVAALGPKREIVKRAQPQKDEGRGDQALCRQHRLKTVWISTWAWRCRKA